MSLENKIIMITGANGGLGTALVREALERNAKRVYCCVRDLNKAEILQQLDARVELCRLDTTDKQSVWALASHVESIDILINNAGINSEERILKETTADFEVNVFGTLNVCRAIEDKIVKGGAIINVSSILALVNLPILGLYAASKSALHSVTQALRAEFALKGIEVYEVFPGPIDTAMSENQPMEKAQPEAIAREIWTGYEAEMYEIYPDAVAKGMKEGLTHAPEAVIAECAESINY